MKISFFLCLAVISMSSVASAEPPAGGGPHDLQSLEKKIRDDLASGALNKVDADELQTEAAKIERIEADAERQGGRTRKTRHDLGRDVGKLDRDIALKEQEEKAAAAPGATPAVNVFK